MTEPAQSEQRFPLAAEVFYRAASGEWVLSITGTINDTHVSVSHTQPGYLVPELVAGLPINGTTETTPPDRSTFAFHLTAKFDILRFLVTNTSGQIDAEEQAERHRAICEKFISLTQSVPIGEAHDFQRGHERRAIRETYDSPELSGFALYDFIHAHTRSLTENLDVIGMCPDDPTPDYQALENAFSDAFYHLACKAVDMWVWAITPEPPHEETVRD